MELYYDTESSGLWRDSLPPEDPSQPRLLQLSAKLCTGDRTEARLTAIIRPDDWTIEPEAQAHHGINLKRAHRVGLPLREVLVPFRAMAEQAKTIVAHHNEFDRRMISRELSALKATGAWWNNRQGFFCTMEESTAPCRLPGKFDGFKFPTLDEAHSILVPAVQWVSHHDAEDDMEACFRLYHAILRLRSP